MVGTVRIALTYLQLWVVSFTIKVHAVENTINYYFNRRKLFVQISQHFTSWKPFHPVKHIARVFANDFSVKDENFILAKVAKRAEIFGFVLGVWIHTLYISRLKEIVKQFLQLQQGIARLLTRFLFAAFLLLSRQRTLEASPKQRWRWFCIS